MKKHLILAGLLFSASASFAQITPDASGFGPLPAATFGGTGIPNNAVAQTTSNGVTLGLTATPRFGSPAVTNDGAGTFFAQAGGYPGSPSTALWNFDYYIGNSVPTTGFNDAISKYNYRLFYDFNPAVGNIQSTHGYFSLLGVAATAVDPIQDSYNLGFAFPPSSVAAGTFRPITTFNPNSLGEYTFKLAAYTTTFSNIGIPNFYGAEAFSTSMVVSAIPEPGEWAMMLAGLGVVSMIARRRRKVTA